MNSAYIQTFSRHKLLFSLPVVVTTLLAIWFAAGASKQYRASASLWVYTASPGATIAQPDMGVVTPAARTQQVLAELLTTKRFRLEVGRRGPLESYMAAHPIEGWGPQALKKSLRGSGTAEDRTTAALDSRHVISIVDGPHVVSIQLDGPAPAVAVGTLRALIETFGDELTNISVGRQGLAVTRLKEQKDGAARAVADFQKQISATNAAPGLTQELRIAQQRLVTTTRAYLQAKVELDTARAQVSNFQVQDAPGMPAPAVGGLKKSLFIVFAGLFAGALLSFLGIVFLTPDRRRDDDAGHGDGFPPSADAVSMEAVGPNGDAGERRSTAKAAGGAAFRR